MTKTQQEFFLAVYFKGEKEPMERYANGGAPEQAFVDFMASFEQKESVEKVMIFETEHDYNSGSPPLKIFKPNAQNG